MTLERKKGGKSKALVKALEKLSRTKAKYGYQGSSGAEIHPDSDLTIADLAGIHEFGAGNIPARPLVRVTAERNRREFTKAAKKAAQKVARAEVRTKGGQFAGRNVDEAVQEVAEIGLAALRETLARSKSWAVPNAPATVTRKPGDQPLVAHEESLRTHASWAVERGDTLVAQGGEEG